MTSGDSAFYLTAQSERGRRAVWSALLEIATAKKTDRNAARNVRMFVLRSSGYKWKEVAAVAGVSSSRAQQICAHVERKLLFRLQSRLPEYRFWGVQIDEIIQESFSMFYGKGPK